MKLDDNPQMVAMLDNAKGSLENKIRQAYNSGYNDGFKAGVFEAWDDMRKQLDKSLRQTVEQTEPQKDKEIVLDPSFAELSDEQFAEAMKLIEPQSDARKFLGYACETCKHRDEEWDSKACDGCCENDDHYEPQTDCSWK